MFLCWCILMHFSPLAQGAALVLAATVMVGGLGHEEGDGRLVNMMRMRRTIMMVIIVGGVLPQKIRHMSERIDGRAPFRIVKEAENSGEDSASGGDWEEQNFGSRTSDERSNGVLERWRCLF